MAMPDIGLQTKLPAKPRITIEFNSDDNVRGTFENFPRKMKLSAINILASGAAVIIIEPEPSPIINPNQH